MANKKTDIKGLANIGKGILSSLEDINNMEETSNQVKEEMCKPVIEEKKKKEKKNFMLTETAIDQLFQLKFKYRKKDYSTIVEEAIAAYYQKNI
ncbi:hypothetical protein [Clostridium tagluense]|uniref:hypothetical protein n=1 Tax=Clostridium tagluense TaxID=360422 RepID=UPI001C0B8E6C|nr:hypothetical protein [Clostridium tagluense]MBU3130723.1 hypothetical protein [Clostridium tagluense]